METILAQALGQDATPSTAEEKRKLLARLLGRVAHEIRNPLSSLDVHLQLLEEDLGVLAPQAKDKLAARLDIIHGELHRLETIVRQFLRLAGPSAVDLAPVDVGRVVNHVRAVLQPEAALRGIEIETRLAEDLPLVMADEEQLIQALLNLVINALQAVGRQGRIEVTAGAGDGRLVLEVRDNGPGVPPESLSVVFDPYFTTKTEGSGLGLWIAQQIMTAHGGTIQAANAPSGGAVFAVSLPLPGVEARHGQVKG